MPPNDCVVENGHVPDGCYLAIQRAVNAGLEPHGEKVDKMYNRMFVDNGKPSIQSTMESHRSQLKFQWWLISILTVAILTTSITVIVDSSKERRQVGQLYTSGEKFQHGADYKGGKP